MLASSCCSLDKNSPSCLSVVRRTSRFKSGKGHAPKELPKQSSQRSDHDMQSATASYLTPTDIHLAEYLPHKSNNRFKMITCIPARSLACRSGAMLSTSFFKGTVACAHRPSYFSGRTNAATAGTAKSVKENGEVGTDFGRRF